MSKKSISSSALKQQLLTTLDKSKKYTSIMFIILVVALYGSVLFRLHTLRNANPTEQSVSAQVKAAKIPNIDPKVVNQLKSLHDNSVNVQTLFDSARSNPFKE